MAELSQDEIANEILQAFIHMLERRHEAIDILFEAEDESVASDQLAALLAVEGRVAEALLDQTFRQIVLSERKRWIARHSPDAE